MLPSALRGGIHLREVVDIGAVALRQRADQFFALHRPPGLGARRDGLGLGEQLLPGRPHDRIAGQRTNQQVVQLLDQPVALVLVHHEGEVEVVGGLAQQVHLLFLEQREGVAELVQDGADVAADQRDRGAGSDDAHVAELRQVALQLA